ncbi:hypothetical protein HanXRQr2_Chr02g0085951 [Helianthus annuus]|uniref:Uncharacterized protein n=1 Tax=Helianthus annuus TaxID=4232 RepID=A0A9K3JS06_HELAN|nr:hypothetical protein HanXRQr2_Chr02g0085951 [Helianthus annuus]KAJ0822999.1 hypothetical protein HanPSC8_Chr16g0738561 [Helianthus annuus]
MGMALDQLNRPLLTPSIVGEKNRFNRPKITGAWGTVVNCLQA